MAWTPTDPAVPYVDDDGLRNYRPPMAASRRARRARWPWVLILLAFLVGFLLGTELAAAEPCVTLTVRPRVLLQRGDIDIQTRIRRHADHRAFTVAWDSDTGSTGSSGPISLEGDQARSLFDVRLPDQPPARYVFEARVYNAAAQIVGRDVQSIATGGSNGF